MLMDNSVGQLERFQKTNAHIPICRTALVIWHRDRDILANQLITGGAHGTFT